MRFQVIGAVKYWEEVGIEGLAGNERIFEEFEATSAKGAVVRAKEIVEKIVKQYPMPTGHGRREMMSCAAELRKVIPVRALKIAPQVVKETRVMEREELALVDEAVG